MVGDRTQSFKGVACRVGKAQWPIRKEKKVVTEAWKSPDEAWQSPDDANPPEPEPETTASESGESGESDASVTRGAPPRTLGVLKVPHGKSSSAANDGEPSGDTAADPEPEPEPESADEQEPAAKTGKAPSPDIQKLSGALQSLLGTMKKTQGAASSDGDDEQSTE
ncbi:MAG: hypothetical protein ACKVHL_03070, partial [Rhodospirillales bacterium]